MVNVQKKKQAITGNILGITNKAISSYRNTATVKVKDKSVKTPGKITRGGNVFEISDLKKPEKTSTSKSPGIKKKKREFSTGTQDMKKEKRQFATGVQDMNVKKLFVTGIRKDIPIEQLKQELQEKFAVYGGHKVRVVIPIERVTKCSKGHAYISFKSKTAAKTSIEMYNETDFHGKSILVQYADDQYHRKKKRPHPVRKQPKEETPNKGKRPTILE